MVRYLQFCLLLGVCCNAYSDSMFDISSLRPGEAKIVYHNEFPVYVVRRTDINLGTIPIFYKISKKIKRIVNTKPQWWSCDKCLINVSNLIIDFRSINKEIFVAYAVSPYLGCQLNYVPEGYDSKLFNIDLSYLPKKWHGGFVDHCTKIMFDMTGRPFFTTYLQLNMLVPPYEINDDGNIVFK